MLMWLLFLVRQKTYDEDLSLIECIKEYAFTRIKAFI